MCLKAEQQDNEFVSPSCPLGRTEAAVNEKGTREMLSMPNCRGLSPVNGLIQ
jgi:hypothetical protein